MRLWNATPLLEGTLKSLMVLWKQLADELASWCYTSTTLDYKKLERRVEHEGDEFLTITLPKFCKDFERSLELGKVENYLFQGFARKGGLPLFLGGFLSRVFDRGTGVLLDEPCVDSILAIRQLTLLFGKILRPCSDARVKGAIAGYVDVEQEVRRNDEIIPQTLLEEFERMSVLLWSDVLGAVDREVYNGELLPKHGPGSTADGLLGNEKYNQIEWTRRLEDFFPYLENVLPSPSYYEELGRVSFLEPDAERPVRVVTVPKTLKTPRIIAIEPTCMQFTQQALAESIVQKLECREIDGNKRRNLAYGFVGFSDQNPNREMARIGSRDKTLATLDMSEASDRVSNQHVVSLLKRWPHLLGAIQATRSTKADVPGHGIIPLSKFASMGSALCFPIEAMVFATLVFVGIQMQHNTQLTRADVLRLRGQVRVYGDDIIIPVNCVGSVIHVLESFGLKVNKDKSFWNGKFRESCGGDYYDGEWVTPVRYRREFPTSQKHAQEVISLVEFRNQIYLAGLWKTSAWLDKKIKPLLGHYPIVEATSPVLGRTSVLPYQAERMCSKRHAPLVKGWYVSTKTPRSYLDGPGALVKWYLKRGEEPFANKDHLVRAGRPRSVDIKIGWRQPF
jgi:hypothetical protein